jgi:hypothetical protein
MRRYPCCMRGGALHDGKRESAVCNYFNCENVRCVDIDFQSVHYALLHRHTVCRIEIPRIESMRLCVHQ